MTHDSTRAFRLIHPSELTPAGRSPDDPGADLRAALDRHDVASRALLFWALSSAGAAVACIALAVFLMMGLPR